APGARRLPPAAALGPRADRGPRAAALSRARHPDHRDGDDRGHDRRRHRGGPARRRGAPDRAPLMRWVILALIVLAQTVANIGPLGVPAIASLIRADLGLTLTQAGSFLSAYYIGPVSMSLFAGILADRWGTARMLVLGQALIAVGLLAASTAPTYGAFIALMIVAGVGYGALNPASTTGAMSWFPPRQRATVVGVKQVGLPFGGMLGAAILPALALAFGWRRALAASALAIAACAITSAIVYR